jgi:hypothetical protein
VCRRPCQPVIVARDARPRNNASPHRLGGSGIGRSNRGGVHIEVFAFAGAVSASMSMVTVQEHASVTEAFMAHPGAAG